MIKKQPSNKKYLWLAGGAVLIGAAVFLLFFHKKKPAAPIKTQYNNFESLTGVGVSVFQVNTTKDAVNQFLTKSNRTAKIVEVDPSTIAATPHTLDTQIDVVTFDLKLDSSVLSAKLEYSEITKIHLYLYEKDSQQPVFDSGDIDNFNSEGETNGP